MVSGFKTSPLETSNIASGDDKPNEILLNFFTVYFSYLLAMSFNKYSWQ
jgi:hypothetical protein